MGAVPAVRDEVLSGAKQGYRWWEQRTTVFGGCMTSESERELEVARRIGTLYGAFEAGQLLIPGMFVLGGVTGWIASRAEGILSVAMTIVVGVVFVGVVIWMYRRTFIRPIADQSRVSNREDR